MNKHGLTYDLTGHSLGGGLASLGSLTTGKPAVTFNAAGLSILSTGEILRDNGVINYSNPYLSVGVMEKAILTFETWALISEAENRITAYRVSGEILTGVQEYRFNPAPDAIGTPYPLLPSSTDNTGIVDAVLEPIELHNMDSVIEAMEIELEGWKSGRRGYGFGDNF